MKLGFFFFSDLDNNYMFHWTVISKTIKWFPFLLRRAESPHFCHSDSKYLAVSVGLDLKILSFAL